MSSLETDAELNGYLSQFAKWPNILPRKTMNIVEFVRKQEGIMADVFSPKVDQQKIAKTLISNKFFVSVFFMTTIDH